MRYGHQQGGCPDEECTCHWKCCPASQQIAATKNLHHVPPGLFWTAHYGLACSLSLLSPPSRDNTGLAYRSQVAPPLASKAQERLVVQSRYLFSLIHAVSSPSVPSSPRGAVPRSRCTVELTLPVVSSLLWGWDSANKSVKPKWP